MNGDLCCRKLSIANKQENNRVYGFLSESYDHDRGMWLNTALLLEDTIYGCRGPFVKS